MTANLNVPNWWERLVVELKRDKKKTTILALLLVVTGVVGGRMIVKQLAPSQAGAAAVPATAVAPSAVATTPHTVSGMLPEYQNDSSVERKKYILQIDHTISRDIFVPNEEYFALEKPVSKSKVVLPDAPKTDNKEAERQAIRAQAQTLTLQCTIDGVTPTAIINGSVVRAGEWINGFKVVKVTSRECTLEKKGVTVILGMKNEH